MKTLYMMIGLPASGKSTWAKQKIAENPGAYKRVNKDDLRAMIDCGKWSRDNEKFIVGVRDYIVSAALNGGKHVIVDDTNLAPKHEETLRQLAKKHGVEFEIVDFRDVSLEECIERDRKRQSYVGEKVIRDMYRQFIAKPVTIPARNPDLPDCIIVDVDGTVALMNGRGPFEWSRVGEDLPNEPICAIVEQLAKERDIIFVSGRDECCRAETYEWMRKVFGCSFPLHMRPAGDMRDDRVVKEEIYLREIEGRYNVLCVIDDRKKVVDFWRSKGLTCLQVAEGEF